jgi:signal transduction histidine kinase
MHETCLPPSESPISPTADLDLQMILEAWNTATQRLQGTHELLRAEVKRLTDELEAKNRELARKNRLADLGQMASHVAHEVRNGLVPMKLYLNLLRRRVTADAGSLEIADKISSGFTALETVVNDLLHFTAHRDPRIQSCHVPSLVQELCDSLMPQLTATNISLVLEVPASLQLAVDGDMLRRAMLNLVLNAIDAMPQGGTLRIAASQHDGVASLEVADTGAGLDDEVVQRIFEPFYSTKSTGTGLGLAIVYRIAEVHGGDIIASNRLGGGAMFTLRLPQNNALTHDPRMVA